MSLALRECRAEKRQRIPPYGVFRLLRGHNRNSVREIPVLPSSLWTSGNDDRKSAEYAPRLGKKVIIAGIRGPAAALGRVRVRLAEARRRHGGPGNRFAEGRQRAC